MADTERSIGFQGELESLINRHSMENGSNTPDYILALYLRQCMEAFNHAVSTRDRWYGVALSPGAGNVSEAASAVRNPPHSGGL